MADAMFRVQFAGPLVTVQDGGRAGHMRHGVPGSGPMDRLAFAAANIALGNPEDAAGLEVSMGGLVLDCLSGTLSLAVAGGDFRVEAAGSAETGWRVFALGQGDRLTIRPGPAGSWTYLTFAGELEAQVRLGHVATHAASGLGGGAVTSGQTLRVRHTELRETRHGSIERPDFRRTGAAFAVVMGPQDKHFTKTSRADFLAHGFALTDAFDRMGVRLSGPQLALDGALSIPSEPVARGSVQVAGDGVATVLLADHQTTGGYPKIATLLSDEADRLSQLRARNPVRFQAVTPQEAIATARRFSEERGRYFERIANPKGTLEQRLMRENLISGAVGEHD